MTIKGLERTRTFDQPPANHAEWPPDELDFLLRVALRGVNEGLLPEMAQLDLDVHTQHLLFEATLRRIEDAS